MSVTSVRVATRAALGLVMLIGGGAALAQARESPFPKVCDQVIGPVEAANQTSAKRGLIHVYRDALGRMVSLEVADTRAETLFLTPKDDPPAIIGNGMIVGSNKGWSPANPANDLIGCGGVGSGYPPFNSQIESFWILGNAVFNSTCQPQQSPVGQTQFYTLHANMYQDVAYWGPGLVARSKNTSGYRPYWDPNGGGVLVFSTTHQGDPNIDFSIQFTQVQGGWF